MSTASLTLSDVLAPRKSLVRDLALVLGGATLTAVCAQIAIPWQPVPFTFQTLAVYLTGLTLGTKRGGAAMGLYLGAAALGAPVLNGGASGLSGVTGGYLLGFFLAALLLGKLAERGWDRKIVTTFAAMVLAEVLILGLGTAWLSAFIGGQQAFEKGCAPFLIPELGKMAIVIAAIPFAWNLVGKRDGEQADN